MVTRLVDVYEVMTVPALIPVPVTALPTSDEANVEPEVRLSTALPAVIDTTTGHADTVRG